MLNTCIKEPHQHLAVFVMQRGGRAHLDFIQNMEYKFVELLSTAFVASDDETVRQNIAFRYNSVKSRLARAHDALDRELSPVLDKHYLT